MKNEIVQTYGPMVVKIRVVGDGERKIADVAYGPFGNYVEVNGLSDEEAEKKAVQEAYKMLVNGLDILRIKAAANGIDLPDEA